MTRGTVSFSRYETEQLAASSIVSMPDTDDILTAGYLLGHSMAMIS